MSRQKLTGLELPRWIGGGPSTPGAESEIAFGDATVDGLCGLAKNLSTYLLLYLLSDQ